MRIEITKTAEKGLQKAPKQARIKFDLWIFSIETLGMEEVRKLSAYHDELLSGTRKGQRSVRLNRQWRVFYIEGALISVQLNEEKEFMRIIEVNPHAY